MSIIARMLGRRPVSGAPASLEEVLRANAGLHRLFPRDVNHLLRLGASLLDRGERASAGLVFEYAEELGAPRWKTALMQAKRYLIEGQPQTALDVLLPFLESGEAKPDPDLCLIGGTAAWDAGRMQAAIRYYETGIAQTPRRVELLGSLCGALGMSGRYQEAYDIAHRALRLDRRHSSALQNLGITTREMMLLDEQREVYADLCDFYPDAERFRCLRSYALLMEENFAEGWPLHESRDFRFREQGFRESTLQRQRWKGEDIAGKTLLIVCEQGAGDNFMVARWFPEIKRRGARVVLECAHFLSGILGRVPGVDQVVPLVNNREPDVPYDLWVGSMSLPLIFNVTRENIYAPARYLEPSRATGEYWRERVSGVRELKVGLAWAGNPGHSNDLARSMKFADVAPLLDVPGTRFYNLQVPARDAPPGARLVNYTDELVTFDDTAGLIDQMDLVIAVDTSICHLACALGKPTWVMSGARPEWRWGRTDLPVYWYPTATLYCCEAPLDWRGVVKRAVRDLGARAAEFAARGGVHV